LINSTVASELASLLVKCKS